MSTVYVSTVRAGHVCIARRACATDGRGMTARGPGAPASAAPPSPPEPYVPPKPHVPPETVPSAPPNCINTVRNTAMTDLKIQNCRYLIVGKRIWCNSSMFGMYHAESVCKFAYNNASTSGIIMLL